MSFLRVLWGLSWVILVGGVFIGPLPAQNRVGRGAVMELYQQHCALCHGADMRGGLGGALLKKHWTHVASEQDLATVIREGLATLDMPGFGGVLSDGEIRAMVVLLREMNSGYVETPAGNRQMDSQAIHSESTFEVRTVVERIQTPWSLAFFPNGNLLISERAGRLRVVENEKLQPPVEGIPQVWVHGQGGLLDVALHPNYGENGWIYLSFAESLGERGGRAVGMTAIARGRIRDNRWVDQEMIFQAPDQMHSAGGSHFGTRLVFQDGYLFFSIGDRGAMQQAQDLSRPNGKIHRIHDDGRIPRDNPFVNQKDAFPSIWTYGNRNPQGLALHPVTGALWESEHGPRGGDEINWIEKGRNYGWPLVTHGINYDGRPITDATEAEGMESPKWYWTPSIAVCGIDFYTGDRFPEWRHHLFVGGLASQELRRLVIENQSVVSDELILKGQGRIRDVVNGPDGYLYLVLNGPDRIVRLEPVR